MVYSHNEIQNTNKNKQTGITRDHINASHKQNIKPNNPDQKLIYIPFI